MNEPRLNALALALAGVAIFAAGCPSPPPPPAPDPSRSEISVDRPTGAVADGVDRVRITVTVRDGNGDPVPGVAVQLSASGAGNALVQPSGPSDASGVATGTLATTAAEAKVLSASIPQGGLASQATAVFGPGPVSASRSTVVVAPGELPADGVASATVTVTLRDASGNAISGEVVSLSASGSGNAFTQPAPTDAGGTSVGVLRSTRAEAKTVTATAGGVALLQQPTLQFVAGAPAQLSFLVPPGSAAAGVAIAPPVQVGILDAMGNLVHGASNPVALSLSGGTAGAALGGTRSAAAAGGVAAFGDLTVDKAGAGYALVASSAGLGAATSAAFSITAGPPSRLAFLAGPSDTAAGSAIPPVQVAIQDASGNVITTGAASIALALSGPGGTLSGTTTAAAASGVATFSDLSIDRAGSGYTLVATAPGFAGATSAPFSIAPAAASRLVFSSQPTGATSGAPLSPDVQVAVQDAFGNTVASDTRAVALALGNNPGGAALSGATSAAAAAGVATFAGLSLDRVGAGYTLVASAPGLTAGVSAPFDVQAGAAARLAFTAAPPSQVTAGLTITPAVQVAVQDAAGNVVSAAANPVTLALTGGAAGAVLSGTLTQPAVNGVAIFEVGVDKAGTGYALAATSPALASATSASFEVIPGPPVQVAFTTQPSSPVAGYPITPAVALAVQDAAGNTVTTSSASITLSLGGAPPGAILSGTRTRNAVAGVATFPGLSVNKAGTGYFLNAASAAFPAATSASFAATPGAPSRLSFTVPPPRSSAAGQAMAIEVTAQDSLGNTAPSPEQTIVLAIASGPPASLGGTTSLVTVGGVAHFTDLHVDTVGSGYSIRATAGALSGLSSAFDIAPGAASRLVFLQQPANAQAGAALSPPVLVVVQDAFGNTAPSTQAVTVSLSGGPPGGVLEGTTSMVPFDGVAAFADLWLPIAGSYRMAAGSGSLAGATSDVFDITGFPPVTGTQVIHHVTDTGLLDRPADLSSVSIGAYVPGPGATFTFHPGSGTDAGTFRILGVPTDAGYYLRFGDDYIAGAARAWDLGFHLQGRPDVARADAGTLQHLVLGGMAPWQAEPSWRVQDSVQMYSSNANAWFSDLQSYDLEGDFLAGGETLLDQTMDYELAGHAGFVPNLVNAARGDETYFTQLTLRDAGFVAGDAGTALAWNVYGAVQRVLGPIPVTVHDGQISSTSGTFAPVPQAASFQVSWWLAEGTPLSFGSFRASVHPDARADLVMHRMRVSALPSPASGVYGGAPDLLSMLVQDGTSSPQGDPQLAFTYGDPFPPAWARFGTASSSFFVRYLVPRPGMDGGAGAPAEAEEEASLIVQDLLPSFPSAPLRPQVSPIASPLIDGASFFADQVLGSTTPVISWSDPAVGPATHYVARIRRLSARPGGEVTRTDVARVYTTGAAIRVPPGILEPGNSYSIRLTAVRQPGFTADAPYEPRWPAHSAAALSGLLTVL